MTSPDRSGLPRPVTRRLRELAVELGRTPPSDPAPRLDEEEFDDLARQVFEYQFGSNPLYRAFCEGRGVTPREWVGWRSVPAVPTRAFKEFDFVSGDSDAVERVFRTSGTSSGSGARGRHPVLSMELYRDLSLPWMTRHLLPESITPDRKERVRILSLVPSAEDRPDSSLAAMVGFLLDAFGDDGSRTLVDADHELNRSEVLDALRWAEEIEGSPVLLIGTAFALVHLLDRLRADGLAFELPESTRAMETGGFKGRSREIGRDELYEELRERLGIAPDRIVNEYGMTELLSQFWEPVLIQDSGSIDGRRHLGPPWTRTRILNPETLHEMPEASPGILAHLDLANVGSVAHVLTEDLGVAHPDGFRVLGRAPGAEPRGCSLAVEELLEVAG